MCSDDDHIFSNFHLNSVPASAETSLTRLLRNSYTFSHREARRFVRQLEKIDAPRLAGGNYETSL